jgi:UDPglucose 6-dehydrogenase
VRKVAVIGSGYVGAVVAASLASVGHRVVGVEVDPDRVASLRAGIVPFYEPGLSELITAQIERASLSFTATYSEAIAGADVAFLCVGTPSNADGSPDTSFLESAAASIAGALTAPLVVVTKSTVPIGSGRWLDRLIDDERVAVVSNPEFLREGTAVKDFLHPDRVVLGSDNPEAIATMVDVYRPILEQTFTGGRPDHRPGLVRTNLETAEIVKYAANAFLAMKISFINEVAQIADAVGADVTEVATAIGMDQRIGSRFLAAGIGWGGSCFGKDLAALRTTAAEHGVESLITGAVVAVNDRQIDFVVDKIRDRMPLNGTTIALLGLAFKPETDDLRDAPSLKLARRLLNAGATVRGYDPIVKTLPTLPELTIAASWSEATAGADVTVVVTEWSEFLSMNLTTLANAMSGNLFIDARNAFDVAAASDAGLEYVGIGRAAHLPRE